MISSHYREIPFAFTLTLDVMTSRRISIFIACFLSFATLPALGGVNNYNSVLIGERAAGMGGAFTGLTGDPSGCSFYNPATLARMEGTSLSASANLYNKNDVRFGSSDNFTAASARVNQGSIRSIPASSGSVAAFGPFAIGLSIITPVSEQFSGAIQNTDTASTYMSYSDDSLWIGGNMALNLDAHQSVGFTAYYTSRNYHRSGTDLVKTGVNTRVVNEETTLTNNTIVYILGYYLRLDNNWSFGLSARPPSIAVSGSGSYFTSTVDTANANNTVNYSDSNLRSEYRIPSRLALGVAYTIPYRWTLSFDVHQYGAESYPNTSSAISADIIRDDPITNYSLGGEYFLKSWLRWRVGVFTNNSARPDQGASSNERAEHVNMWGFSTNFGIFTSDKVAFTIGGYYTGGQGHAIEMVGQQWTRVAKSEQIFSMIVGSSFFF